MGCISGPGNKCNAFVSNWDVCLLESGPDGGGGVAVKCDT